MSPSGRKTSNMLLRKSRGQVQVAPELMKWLGQSRKDAQLRTCLEIQGKSDAAKRKILHRNLECKIYELWGAGGRQTGDGKNKHWHLGHQWTKMDGTFSRSNDQTEYRHEQIWTRISSSGTCLWPFCSLLCSIKGICYYYLNPKWFWTLVPAGPQYLLQYLCYETDTCPPVNYTYVNLVPNYSAGKNIFI